ncbi:hypothetical protein BC830DRAFT_1088486 [Chytriomyces sp. MP71]|nr:hypothetical protein BC830DRAFT_1088486 [Chytriomyces sp. MP71]
MIDRKAERRGWSGTAIRDWRQMYKTVLTPSKAGVQASGHPGYESVGFAKRTPHTPGRSPSSDTTPPPSFSA